MMEKDAKIYICGHTGLVGNAALRVLKEKGYQNLITRTFEELDLRDQKKLDRFMQEERPEYIFLFAARVGGIKANIDFPAEFLYDNIMIEANVIQASFKYKARKLLFLASSCIYPRNCPQPLKEEYILTGKFEPTNEGYALAKIAGIKLCEYYNKQFKTDFICLVPTNLYGPNDNFNSEYAHVLPALIRRFHEAKINKNPSVTVWGTGRPKRELMYVDDLADACLYFMKNYDQNEIVNIGLGEDICIKDLSFLIKDIVGFTGKIIFDRSKTDGMPQRLLDITQATKIGWKAKTKLTEGIKMTYAWYCQNPKNNESHG